MFRNNERKSGSAKRSFKHVALKVSDAKQFPNSDLIFWFVFYQEKMNNRKLILEEFKTYELETENKFNV